MDGVEGCALSKVIRNHPHLDATRIAYVFADAAHVMIHDGIWDVPSDFHMGYAAEITTEKFDISRHDMDSFAAMSNERANKSIKENLFADEIVPVSVPRRKGEPIIVDKDETPKDIPLEKLQKLKPAFKKGGSVTAGNASKISDGAAAVLLMSEEKAKELGLKPVAYVGAQATAGMELEDVLVTPIKSIPKSLKKAGLSIEDIDLYEINEAFATSTVAISKTLDIPFEKINVHGGAVALGHPIGASGARILVTLLYAMEKRDSKRGMASLCLGGAEAVSLIVERKTN